MTDVRIRVEVDYDADAAYISLSDEAVVETVQIAEHVTIDLDKFRMVVGVEVMRLTAEIPFSELNTKYHVHSELVEQLRKIQPSISGFLSVTQGSDSTIRSSERELATAR